MACLPRILPAIPPLPFPLTIAPTLPTLSFDPALCCKVLPFSIATPPIPLPAGSINIGTILVITNAMASVQKYLNSLSIPCPKE